MRTLIKHQTQLTPLGCPLAVLAMLTDTPQHDLLNEGIPHQFSLDTMLAELTKRMSTRWKPTLAMDRLTPGFIYVLAVPALHATPGGMHLIILDFNYNGDITVIDSSYKYKYGYEQTNPDVTPLIGWCPVFSIPRDHFEETIRIKRKYLD